MLPSLERKSRKIPSLNQSAINNFALYVMIIAPEKFSILNSLVNLWSKRMLCQAIFTSA